MSHGKKLNKVESFYLTRLRKNATKQIRDHAYTFFMVMNWHTGELTDRVINFYLKDSYDMAKHYEKIRGKIINNKSVDVRIQKGGAREIGGKWLSPVDYIKLNFIEQNPKPEVKIPKIKLDMYDESIAKEFDFIAFINVNTSLLSHTARKLGFHFLEEYLGATGGAMSDEPCEIIIKNKSDVIVADEIELIKCFENTIKAIKNLLPVITKAIKDSEVFNDAQWNVLSGDDLYANSRLINFLNSEKGVQLSSEVKTSLEILKNKIGQIQTSLSHGYPVVCEDSNNPNTQRHVMTLDTEYSVQDYYAKNAKNKSNFPAPTAGTLPFNIIPHIIIAKEAPFLASEAQLSSLMRLESINFLFQRLLAILNCLKSNINGPLSNFIIDGEYAAQVTLLSVTEAQIGGLSDKEIMEIISAEIYNAKKIIDAKYKPKESKSLKNFVEKIGMPIDISETGIAGAEKAISARLKKLGKTLADKYGVEYVSDPGSVAVSAMRRSDSLDDIMLEISDAIEDCFALVQAHSETEGED